MSDRVTGVEARELLAGSTPGPWRSEAGERGRIITSNGHGPVALVHYRNGASHGEVPAWVDAQLIAAAPRLAETIAWLYEREPDTTNGPGGISEWITPQGSVVWTAPGGTVMVQNVEPGDLTPTEAVDLARALLAAADEAVRDDDR